MKIALTASPFAYQTILIHTNSPRSKTHSSKMKPPKNPSDKANNSTTTNDNNNARPHTRLTTIIGSFLETAIHELVYLRSLYPFDAFSPNRHLQISVHACRHPQVVDYIFHTLDVAVPSIINGDIDALYLIFYNEDTNQIYERFGFDFDFDARSVDYNDGNDNGKGKRTNNEMVDKSDTEKSHNRHKNETPTVSYIIHELERSLRDVLLSIISLDGTDLGRRTGRRNFPDATTFKLCSHTTATTSNKQNSLSLSKTSTTTSMTNSEDVKEYSPELKNAIESGKWMRSDADSCQILSSSSYNLRNQLIDSPLLPRNTDDNDAVVVATTTTTTTTTDKCVSRPLKSLNVPSCGLRMQVMMDFRES